MKKPNANDAIVIFGAGDFGRRALLHYRGQYRIVAFVDNDPKKLGSLIEGIPVHLPNDLPHLPWDWLFIASSHAPEILCELKTRYQVPPERIFEVPVSTIHANAGQAINLAANLHQLVSLLDRFSIPYWLDHSSLLGLLRDGDPCFVDIDLAILDNHLPALQAMLDACYPPNAVCVRRYGFSHDLWRPTDIQQIKLFHSIDIHVKMQSGGKVFWLVGPRLLYADRRFYDGCAVWPWQGTPLSLPNHPHAYLTQLYGVWEHPLPHWTYADYANVLRVFGLNEMQNDKK